MERKSGMGEKEKMGIEKEGLEGLEGVEGVGRMGKTRRTSRERSLSYRTQTRSLSYRTHPKDQ